MQVRVRQGVRVMRRVAKFMATTEVQPSIGPVAKAAEKLDGIIERITADMVAQDASFRAYRALATAARAQVAVVREEFMLPVARLGQALFPADLPLRQALKMPKAVDNEGIVTAALAMAARAREHRPLFVDAGFHPEFIERMTQAATELKALLDAKEVEFGHRSAATDAMLHELAQGRKLVRLLDAMMRPQLKKTPGALAEWKTIARFVRVAPEEVAEPEEVPVPAPDAGGVTEKKSENHAA